MTTPPAHVQSLDAVRALAIAVVMMFHAGAPAFGAGWLGVDLFFALSGFLITTLLLQEQARNGHIVWRSFIVRRSLRLMPAYLLYAAFITAAIWAWPGSVRSTESGWTAAGLTAALWGYFINWVPQGGVWNGQELTVHLWSLAVEQQYYLVWPPLLMWAAPRPARLLAMACLLSLATVASFLLTPWSLMFTSALHTRGFTLILASTAAIWAHQNPARVRALPWRPIGVASIALVLAAALLDGPLASLAPPHAVHTHLLPLLSVAFVLWVLRLWYAPAPAATPPGRVLRAVRYVGEVSYGIYLYHEAVRVLVWHLAKPAMMGWPSAPGYATRLALYVGLSIAVAALSYEYFEKPFLRLRGRFRA